MELYEPAWLKYMQSQNKKRQEDRGIKAPKPSIVTGKAEVFRPTTPEEQRLAGLPDLAQAQKEYEASQLVAGALGQQTEGKPSKGLLSKALDVITFVPAVATAAVKEFVVDPMYQVAYAIQDATRTPEERAAAQEREKVSLDEFKKNVKERNFAQEMYKELAYEKDAPIWEKFLKEAAGFGIDIASTGGFGTGIRAAGLLGRKVATKTVANSAEDVFRRNATRFADETDQQFNRRAVDFGAKAGVAAIKGRSRGVRKVFEEEFKDKDLAKQLFDELPKDAQGGLQLVFRGRTVANLNAGGYLVDDIAKTLRLDDLAKNLNVPSLTQSTEKLVNAYQNTKNVLRADLLTTPGVAAIVGRVNKVLNNISGEQSRAWQSFVKTAVSDAKERDVIQAFKSFQAVPDITSFRNLRGKIVEDTNDFFKDFERFKKAAPDDYARAVEYMRNPAKAVLADANDPDNDLALAFYKRYRNDYDRYHKLLVANGFDVGYLDEYLPLMFVQAKDQAELGRILGVGPKNIPGAGYRPEKARTKFMKDQIDPVTKKVVRDADGNPVQVPMTPSEIKNMFIRQGRKDLADMIEDDPLVMLARYSTNVSRLLATRVTINNLLDRGVLWRSTAMQLYPDQAQLQKAIATMEPDKLGGMMKEFLDEPGAMSKFFESLNDDLARAYSTNDQQLIAQSKAQVEAFMNSLGTLSDDFMKQIRAGRSKVKRLEEKLAKEQSDELEQTIQRQGEIVGELATQREYIKAEQKRLRAAIEGREIKDSELLPKTLADTLAMSPGTRYRPIGGSEAAMETSFYLPKELAELTGEESLVNLIDRTMLLRRGDKKMLEETMQSIDQYLQFFRVGATFGRLSGFVLRNGYGAVQNNVIIAGSTAADHKVAQEVAKARVLTDYALTPFTQLSRADLATKRLDKLIDKGRLTESQAKRLREDISRYGAVQTKTVGDIREEILEGILGQKPVREGVTQWDVYKTAVDGGIYDRYVILPASQGLDADDASVVLLGVDPSRIVVRTDKAGRERGGVQKVMEGILNFGGTISADVAGRTINLRPVQLTRDLNQLMEEWVRLAPITTGLRKYGAEKGGAANAIMLMKAAQFDYSDLSDVERQIFRRVMPFYTYMKNNIAAQTRVLMNDPERIRRNLAGWEAVGNVFSDENGQNIVLPDYVGEMYGFLIDEDIRKALLKKSPSWLQAIMQNPLAFRPESPVLDLERYTRGGGGAVAEELISSSNPLAKAILQFALNENLFSGREYTMEDPAPNWFIATDKLLKTATGGAIDLGVRKSDRTGEFVADGRIIDIFKTMLPQIGTLERTALPLLDATIEAATGNPTDLSGSMSERAISNLLSQLGGVNVITVTPEVEEGVYRTMRQNIKDTIAMVAMDRGISREKLSELVYSLRDRGFTKEEIFQAVEQARQDGQLTPDVG